MYRCWYLNYDLSAELWDEGIGHLHAIDIECVTLKVLIYSGLNFTDAKTLHHSVRQAKPIQVQGHLQMVQSLLHAQRILSARNNNLHSKVLKQAA